MNLEELISKYLDSELSEAEDKELRRLTANDSDARMRFDALVSLHMAYKEDAESIEPPANLVSKTEQTVKLQMLLKKDAAMIIPPSGLVSSTEEKILAMMAEDEDNKVIPIPFWIPSKKLYGMAAAIALFFFFTVFDIQDQMFDVHTSRDNDLTDIVSVQNNMIPEAKDESANLFNTDNVVNTYNVVNTDNLANTDNVVNTDNVAAENPLISTRSANRPAIDNSPTPSAEIVEPASRNSSDIAETAVNNDIEIINARATFVARNMSRPAADEKKSKRMLSESSRTETLASEENIAAANDEHLIAPEGLRTESSVFTGTADASTMNNLQLNESLAKNIPTETLDHNRISANEIVPGFVEQNFYKGGEEIQVTSFFGTDLLRNGIAASDDIVVSHISQSVAYSINDYSTLGAEIGYSSYDYVEDSNNKKVSGFQAKTSSGIEASGAVPTGHLGPREFLMNKTKQIFWGSVFYEIKLYNSEDFSLSGRIGAGSSSEGPLGFGKVFAGYRLFSGFHLTFGAEGRMFVAKLPSLTGTGDDLKSSATLVYGFQIDL